jgi:hypothetical protein
MFKNIHKFKVVTLYQIKNNLDYISIYIPQEIYLITLLIFFCIDALYIHDNFN